MRATQGAELEAISRAMAATTGETSAQASNDISQQIATIQLVTQEAVMAIKAIAQTIGEVRRIASAIAEAVEEQGAATQEIARNIQEAAAGTQQVSISIVSVNHGAQETDVAATERVPRASC